MAHAHLAGGGWVFQPAGFAAPTKAARPELKQQVSYDPSSQPLHSVENLGTVPYQAYRVELKPVTSTPLKKSASDFQRAVSLGSVKNYANLFSNQ